MPGHNMLRSLLFPLLLLLALAGCADVSTWKQKMVVEVETPEGVVTGESVVGVRFGARRYLSHLDGSSVKWSADGEAVVVDLGERGYLFALLKGEEGYMGDPGPNASWAFTDLTKYYASSEEAMDAIAAWPVGKKAPLPRKAYPLLVTFGDRSDPTSIKQVDPENLAATFGPGVRLKSLTLEKTKAPVTRGIIPEVLPGLKTTTGLWVPINKALPYGHPLHHVPGQAFWSYSK